MRRVFLIMLLSWACPLVAQPVTIRFVVDSEIKTEMTSVTNIQVMTKDGPYTLSDIKTMTFWENAPDSASLAALRYSGIGVYLKYKYLKPISAEILEASKRKEELKSDTIVREDPIRLEGRTYWKSSRKMSEHDIRAILESDNASYYEARAARSNANALHVVGFIGGFLIGYPIGQEIAGKVEPQWGMAAGGAALLLMAGIPLNNAYKRHMRNAIELYNSNPKAPRATSLRLVPGLNGATLYVKF